MNEKLIFDLIEEHIRFLAPEIEGKKIEHTHSFSELGINSLDKMDIVTIIMEKLELKILQSDINNLQTLGELAKFLAHKKEKNNNDRTTC